MPRAASCRAIMLPADSPQTAMISVQAFDFFTTHVSADDAATISSMGRFPDAPEMRSPKPPSLIEAYARPLRRHIYAMMRAFRRRAVAMLFDADNSFARRDRHRGADRQAIGVLKFLRRRRSPRQLPHAHISCFETAESSCGGCCDIDDAVTLENYRRQFCRL